MRKDEEIAERRGTRPPENVPTAPRLPTASRALAAVPVETEYEQLATSIKHAHQQSAAFLALDHHQVTMPTLEQLQEPIALNPSKDAADTNLIDLPTYNILLTGFGPFGKNKTNPSFMTVSKLPENLIFRSDSRNYRARLFVYPAAIRTSYTAVQEAIPSIFGSTFFDHVVHLGMAPGSYYRLETVACKECDRAKDVDGMFRDPGREPSYWKDLPDKLPNGINAQVVISAWEAACDRHQLLTKAMPDLRESKDAGQFMCDYIFYSSLAWFTHAQVGVAKKTKVVFLHIPPFDDDETLEKNAAVTESLVHALILTGPSS